MVTYRRIRGAEQAEVSAEQARAAWDGTHPDYRLGQYGGSFIVFQRDALGYKVNPTLYKPSQGDACTPDSGT